jgi:hypothetical protein
MSSDKQDIDITGMIIAERKAAPSILTPVKEALHNSLEAIRLARLFDSRNKGMIKLIFHIRNNRLEKFAVFDQATGNTGIKNLESKQIYKLYKHEGTKAGFSEYGIGSKLENLRCCDLVQHHTITDLGSYECTAWHIPISLDKNSLLDIIDYRKDPSYQPMRELFDEGFKTGTLLECSYILPRLQNIDTATYIKSTEIGSLYEDINHSLVQFDSENVQIFYKVVENGVLIINETIVSKDYLHGYRETHDLICCVDKKNSEQLTFIKVNQELQECTGFESILNNEITNHTIKADDVFISYYDGQKIDSLGSEKPKVRLTCEELKTKYLVKSHIKLICSTAEYQEVNLENPKKGFIGLREVEGENIVCTTPEPLSLKWKILSSHKTRHNQLRVGIQYDRKSDEFLLSDKSKTLSEDRDIDPSLRFNAIKLTAMYMSKMKEDYDFYNTDRNKEPAPVPLIKEIVSEIEFEIENDSPDEDKKSESESESSENQQTVIAVDSNTSSDEESETESDEESGSRQNQQTVVAVDSNTSSDEESETESDEESGSSQDQLELIVVEKDSGQLLSEITEYTTKEQKRMHVNAESAVKCLDAINIVYQKDNLMSEAKELLVKIACNLLGKGGCPITELFIKDVPFDKLYSNIKTIWLQESESSNNVKMGSEIVNFVITHDLEM